MNKILVSNFIKIRATDTFILINTHIAFDLYHGRFSTGDVGGRRRCLCARKARTHV